MFKVAQVWRTGSFKWHPLLLAFLYQKRYTPYKGPINIRCEKYINDSYITKQSDLHYVKKSADKLRQINKKIDFALKTYFYEGSL